MDNKDLFLEPNVKQYGNHMVMTNVMKPSKIKYYNIDTRFRDDYDEYADKKQTTCNITLPQRINDVKSVHVCSAEIPLSYYNISASLGNNAFEIIRTSDNSAKTIIVPDGNYNSNSLRSVIQNQIDFVGFSDISFNIVNNHSSFISSNSYTFQFAISTVMTTSGISQNDSLDKFNFKSKLGWLLGFRNITYNKTSILSEAFTDLNGPKYLYLVVDEYNNGNQNSFVSPLYSSILNKNILAKICIDNNHYEFGKILTVNNYNGYLLTDKRSYNGKIDLQRLKVQIVNEMGLPIDFNGLDFSFTLEIEYE
jgi:hypothetical protein